MVRYPAVADQFYPKDPGSLRSEVLGYLEKAAHREHAMGIVVPHAGYMYSGSVAGKVYSRIVIPRKVILMGVNHRGTGEPAAIMDSGFWRMPNGDVELDTEVASRIINHCPLVRADASAHQYEHSLEVQVPFLQALRPDFKLTPLALSFMSYADCRSIGEAVARSIRDTGEPVLIVASSDMTHYETQDSARNKDKLAMERIAALDPEGLHRTVIRKSISMCGVIPVTTTLVACLELGATIGEVAAYATSGDVNRDYSQVVGYAGVIIR